MVPEKGLAKPDTMTWHQSKYRTNFPYLVNPFFEFNFYCQSWKFLIQTNKQSINQFSDNSNARTTFDYSQFDNESPSNTGVYPTLPRVPSAAALRNGTVSHQTQPKKIDISTQNAPNIPRVPSLSQLRQTDDKPRSLA